MTEDAKIALDGIITEIGAGKTFCLATDAERAYNIACDRAISIACNYRDGIGLFQIVARAKSRAKKIGSPPKGYLEVGMNESGEIVINHPDLKPDADGVGHIVFSVDQARHLAELLVKHANESGAAGPGMEEL